MGRFKVLFYSLDIRALTLNDHVDLAHGGPYGTLGATMNIWTDEHHRADDQLFLGIL